MFMIHHPAIGAPPDLRGEGASDMIAVRFDCALDDMKRMLTYIRKNRRTNYGLPTHDLYISDGGRRLVHCEPNAEREVRT